MRYQLVKKGKKEITEVKSELDSKTIIRIANMDEVKHKIVRLMGKSFEKYYL
jgi:flagellar motor switch protein FliG